MTFKDLYRSSDKINKQRIKRLFAVEFCVSTPSLYSYLRTDSFPWHICLVVSNLFDIDVREFFPAEYDKFMEKSYEMSDGSSTLTALVKEVIHHSPELKRRTEERAFVETKY